MNKYSEILKNEEMILFYQMNRFNNASYFEIRPEDRFINYSTWDDKVLTDDTAKEFFFKDSDFVSFFNSTNTIKFLLYQIIFKEYQYFIFDTLSRQSFIGKYILGYEIDRFYSRFLEKDLYLKRVEKFRRSLKKFRKNATFKKNDEKFLNLLNPFVQEGLVKNIIYNLVEYNKFEKDLNAKLEKNGVKVDKKQNMIAKTIRTIKSVKTNKSHKDK